MRSTQGLIAVLSALSCRSTQEQVAPQTPQVSLTPNEHQWIAQATQDELERWDRERRERWIEARDPGEDREHTRRISATNILTRTTAIDAVFLQGESVFEHEFSVGEGLGTFLSRGHPGLSRVQGTERLRGADAFSCVECHHRGGDDGHGELHHRAWLGGDGRHLSSAYPRVAPMLAGVGYIDVLAREMSEDLQAILRSTQATAQVLGARATGTLVSKGITFGRIHVDPSGTVDTHEVTGVRASLQVRPFGWHGRFQSIETFTNNAVPQHLGIELHNDGAPAADLDHDNVYDELSEGSALSLAVYLALLDVPVVVPPRTAELRDAYNHGEQLFARVGCASCHTPSLAIRSTQLAIRPGFSVDLVADNQVPPGLARPDSVEQLEVPLFSDLRLHDMGAGLWDVAEDRIGASTYITRPLWGIGDRGPYYLHDGRARTIDQAIEMHGGEATPSVVLYRQLDGVSKRELAVFLLSLRRAPQARIAP